MKPPTEPEVFLKGIGSLTGPFDPISRGPNKGVKLDWETELTVVIGREAFGLMRLATIEKLHLRATEVLLSDEVITIHRIVVAEATRFPEIGQALYEAGPKRGKLRLVAYLKQAIADGRLKSCDPERAAEQAMEMALGGMYRKRLWNVGPAPTEAEIEAAIASAVDVFMAAYGA